MLFRVLILILTLVSTPAFAATYYDALPERDAHNKLFFSSAVVWHDRLSVIRAGHQGVSLDEGILHNGRYTSYAIGAGVEVPLALGDSWEFNGVAQIDTHPGVHVTVRDTQGQGIEATAKTHRTNYAIGFRGVRHITSRYFVHALGSIGLTNVHLHAHATGNTNEYDGVVDHPGFNSYQALFTGEIGFGKRLADDSRISFFFQNSFSRRDRPFATADSSAHQFSIAFDVPNNWIKLGIVYTKNVTL